LSRRPSKISRRGCSLIRVSSNQFRRKVDVILSQTREDVVPDH
jgi:hypothetical protein